MVEHDVFNTKGAIRNALSDVAKCDPDMVLFEVIDDRLHSLSDKVFIDINKHDKKLIIGFNKGATREQINCMVEWFNIGKVHTETTGIANRGHGLKYLHYKYPARYSHLSITDDNKFYMSSADTAMICKKYEDNNTAPSVFMNTLLNCTRRSIEPVDEILQSHNDIFKNKDNYYPFSPKTLIIAEHIEDPVILDYFIDNRDDLQKKLLIKYYREVSKGELELYIKYPSDTSFTLLSIKEDTIDVIGTTSPNNLLNINIYICPNALYKYIFEINNKVYEFKKNGTSVLRATYTGPIVFKDIQPDFILTQYNIVALTNKQKRASIIGSAVERYAGLYVDVGGTLINCEKASWDIVERNLPGNSNYRAILYINTCDGKYDISLSGLKAQFNLATKKDIHKVIKELVVVYKKYIEQGLQEDPDTYVLVKSTAQKNKEGEVNIKGRLYLKSFGPNFYKYGLTAQRQPSKRLNISKEEFDKIKEEFPDEEYYNIPICIYMDLWDREGVHRIEKEIEEYICNSDKCITYKKKKGAGVREFFNCKTFYEDVFPGLVDILQQDDSL